MQKILRNDKSDRENHIRHLNLEVLVESLPHLSAGGVVEKMPNFYPSRIARLVPYIYKTY